jgi:hypothetical protein
VCLQGTPEFLFVYPVLSRTSKPTGFFSFSLSFSPSHGVTVSYSYTQKRGTDTVYGVFVRHRDGTYLAVASCNDLEQAVQIVETLSASWPRKYVVRNFNR